MSLLDHTLNKYSKDRPWLIDEAAKAGNRELINALVVKGAVISYLASTALEEGHKELALELIERGDKEWLSIAASAAKVGDMKLLEEMMKKDINEIIFVLQGAVRGCNYGIFTHIINEWGYLEYSDCEELAEECNDLEIADYLLQLYPDLIAEVACSAAQGGNKETVIEMMKRGYKDCDKLACYAVRGGHRDILDLVMPGVYNIDTVIKTAKASGNENIL